jgi:phosphatidate cytidylyltransferase
VIQPVPGDGPAEAGRIGAAHAGASGTHNLVLRIASAAVLTPLVIAAAYVGGWTFSTLCALGAAGVLWEWTGLVAGRSAFGILLAGWSALLAALVLTGFGATGWAVGAIVIGAVVAGLAAAWRLEGTATRWPGAWAAAGVVYAGIAFLGPALLRRSGDLGFEAFLFLAATVWTTDIFAYFVGRAIGGALLWPRVSPGKTWAGAIGGLAAGVAGGLVVAYAVGVDRLGALGGIALVLSALSQAGDLFESAVKRHFGTKDASRLIPGHGGLMDRLDGFLVAAFTALVIGALHQGIDASASGLLVW